MEESRVGAEMAQSDAEQAHVDAVLMRPYWVHNLELACLQAVGVSQSNLVSYSDFTAARSKLEEHRQHWIHQPIDAEHKRDAALLDAEFADVGLKALEGLYEEALGICEELLDNEIMLGASPLSLKSRVEGVKGLVHALKGEWEAAHGFLLRSIMLGLEQFGTSDGNSDFVYDCVVGTFAEALGYLLTHVVETGFRTRDCLRESIAAPGHCHNSHALYPIFLLGLGALGGEGTNFQVTPLNVERLKLDCARQFSRRLGATSPACSSAYDKVAIVLKEAKNKDYELMIMAESFQLAESIHLAQSVGETHSENDPLLEGSSDQDRNPFLSLKVHSSALRLKLSMCTEIETDSEIQSLCQRISEAITLIAQTSLDGGEFKRPAADAHPVDVMIHSLCFIALLHDDDRRLEALEEVAAAISKGRSVQEATWINASLRELADRYIRRGAYKKAAHIYHLDANMTTDIKTKLSLRSNEAGNLYQAGELEKAIVVIEGAARASIHLNESEWKSRAMIHISAASFLDKSGQTDRAIAAREEALRNIRDHAMSYEFSNEMDWQLIEGMIKLLQNYAAQRNWSAAYKLIDSIDAHVDKDFYNQPIWRDWCNNKYSVAMANGDYESAMDILDNSSIMAENTSIQNLTLYKLDKMAATADHHETRGKWKKAIQETNQMLELINNQRHSMDSQKKHKREIMVRLHRNYYYSQCKDLASAHEELEKALAVSNSVDDQDVSAYVGFALVQILCFKAVDAATRNGDFVESERLMSLAKSKVPKCNNALELAEVEFSQAKLLSHKKKWVEAADKARAAALLAMEEQRRQYHLDRGPTSWLFFSTEIGLNEKLWFMEELYTFFLRDVMTGLVWAERSQMRFLLHQVHSQPKETAIPNPSHLDECDTLLSSLIFQTVRALPTKTAVIEYSYNPNRELIYMYVMERTPDGEDASVRCKRCHLPTWFKDARLPSNKSLQELTEDAIDEQGPSIEALTILHALLIQFIEDDLKSCDSLIFVPGHGYLAKIPYAALYDDRHKQHLIARYNVAVVPSIVTLHRCLYSQYNFEMSLQLSGPSLLQEASLEPGPSRVSRQSLTIYDPGKSAPHRVDPWILDGHLPSKVVFIAGNPVPMGLGLGQLSSAEEEAKEVAGFFKVTPCVGRDMTKQAVLDGLSTSKVVLLATHGIVHETDYPYGCLVLQASPQPDEIASTMLPPEVDLLGLNKQPSDVALAMASTSKVSSTAIPIVDLKGKGIAQEEERDIAQHGGHQEGMRNWRHSEFTDIRSKQKRAKEAPQILTAEEIVALEGGISAGLVVLSACQSGLGKATISEGVLGLGRALLQAGAVSTILTLWEVKDAFSMRFITDLFKELLTSEPRGRSVSECLKKVMLSMIREGQPLKNWAAFTIVGSPALRLSKLDNNWGVSGLDKNSYLLFSSKITCPYPCRVCEEKIKIHKESITVYNIISGDDTDAEDQPRELDELMRSGARLERIDNTNSFILKMQDGSYKII